MILDFLKKNKVHLSRNLRALILSNAIRGVAGSIVTLFGVIFFYEQFGNSISKVLLLYAILYFGFTLITHFGAKLIQKIGMKRMMIFAILFLTGSHLVRVFWEFNPVIMFTLYFLFFTGYKGLFWIPCHVELASFSQKGSRGRQFAVLGNLIDVLSILMPIISGYVLLKYGYYAMFYLSSFFVLISVIPLFFIEETKEVYEWSGLRLIKELFQKENRSVVLGNLGYGIESAVSQIIWPVFIFVLLSGNYLSVGIVVSLVILTTIVLRTIMGSLTDRLGNKASLGIGSFIQISGWLSRIFVTGGVGVYLADSYYRVGKEINLVPFNASIYDEAEYNDDYIDEYTVMRETALLIGKGGMAFVSILLIQFFSIQTTFIIAAFSVLLIPLVSQKVKVD